MQETPGTATAEDALIGALLTLGRQLRQRAPGDAADVSFMPVLKVLHACGAVRHTRLAELLQLDTSTVSRKVRHLEELGLVQVVADREDGRARQVELLPAGREALEQLLAVRRAAIRQVLAHWPARDREQLRVLLDRLVTDLEAAPGPA